MTKLKPSIIWTGVIEVFSVNGILLCIGGVVEHGFALLKSKLTNEAWRKELLVYYIKSLKEERRIMLDLR